MRGRGRLRSALVGFAATTLLFAGSSAASWTATKVGGGSGKAGWCETVTVTETVYVANEATVVETVPEEPAETGTTAPSQEDPSEAPQPTDSTTETSPGEEVSTTETSPVEAPAPAPVEGETSTEGEGQ